MKIGLCQVDGKIPNMALMQISGYHEDQGHKVEWWKGPLFNDEYDLIYASKIFAFTEMPNLPDRAIIGGTGINFTNRLPEEMASYRPSWTLYNDYHNHLGFSMKGCRFHCKFCCVPQKEGKPWANSSVDDMLTNPRGENRLVLLDNDFFGGPSWKTDLQRIIDLKLKVCFVQGLNIRIITPEQAELLAQAKYWNGHFTSRYLTFAWDRTYDERLVMKGVDICTKAGIPTKHMQFFVLIGFDSTPEQDMHRIMTLKRIGAMPFVMPYNKDDRYQKNLARWVNNRALFGGAGVDPTCTFDEFQAQAKVLKTKQLWEESK